jgi:hypothetical protein
MATKTKKRPVAALARWAAANSILFNCDPSPFHAVVDTQAARLVVVTGENASGKSLFVRVISAIAQTEDDMVPVSVSIRERTGSGHGEMDSLRRAFMFGDEHENSTGATSVGTVATAFRNLGHAGGAILILDEPEIGLSEGYARALGEFIGQQAKSTPRTCRGVVVVSHSRPLVRGLLDGFGRQPTHAAISGSATPKAGISNWLAADEHRTVQELLALRDTGLDRWRQVLRILRND